jgi:hypothetical protein
MIGRGGAVYAKDIRSSDLTDVQCLWFDESIFTRTRMSDVSKSGLKIVSLFYIRVFGSTKFGLILCAIH